MLNKTILIGRLTKDPEIKMTPSGVEVATFTLAVKREFKNPQGQYDVDFINCVAYRNTAKFAGQYGFKGQLVNCEGRLQVRSYDKDNQKHYVTEVIVENFRALEFKQQQTQNINNDSYFSNNGDVQISPDDMPF